MFYQKNRHMFFFPAVLLVAMGCAQKKDASTIDQNEIYTEYESIFDNLSTTKLTHTATFYDDPTVRDTTLTLDGSSSVTVDNIALEENTLNLGVIETVSYSRNETGGSAASVAGSSAEFVYTNNDGTIYTNSITIPPVTSLSSVPATLDKATSYTVTWSSEEQIGSDSITVHIEPDSGDTIEKSANSLTSTLTGDDISFTTVDLTDLQTGAATVKVCRKRSASAGEAPEAGGSLSGQFCSDESSITVTDSSL